MKDNIAFGTLILSFLIGGYTAWAYGPLHPAELDAQIAREVRYFDPITVVGYRDPPGQGPSQAAIAQAKPVLEIAEVKARHTVQRNLGESLHN